MTTRRGWGALRFVLVLLLLASPGHFATAGINQWTPTGPEGGYSLAVAPHPTVAGLVFAAAGRAIYRSTDDGQTWVAVRSDVLNGVRRILVDPSNGSRIFALNGNAIYLSLDSGATFEPAGTPASPLTSLQSMAIGPGGILYAGAGGDGGHVYRTANAGLQWEDRSTGLPTDSESSIVSLTVDPTDAQIVYAITLDGRLYRTLNGGASWSPLLTAPSPPQAVKNVAVDPGQPTSLLAATAGGLFASPDRGDTWALADGSGRSWVAYHPSGDGAAIALSANGTTTRRSSRAGMWSPGQALKVSWLIDAAYDPKNTDVANSTVWIATSDGPMRTQNSGVSFQLKSQGIRAGQVRALATSKDNIYAAFAGGPSGLHRRSSLASGWQPVDNVELRNNVFMPFDPLALAVDPAEPNTIFVASGTSVVYSLDGGDSWSMPASAFGSPNDIPVRALAFDPSDPPVRYAGTYEHRLYRSTTSGLTWTQGATSGAPLSIGTLAVDPSAAGLLYAAEFGAPGLYKSSNGGLSWDPSDNGLAGSVTSLSIDPSNTQTVYATTAGNAPAAGVYRTTDGGQSWAQLAATQAANDIDIDPVVPTNLVMAVSSQGRPQRSVDSGATWENLEFASLADLHVLRQVVLDPLRPHVVLASTEDFGLLEFEVSPDLQAWRASSSGSAVPLNGSLPSEVTVTNRGPLAASAVELTLTMPVSTTATVTATDQGTCSATAQVVRCSLGVVRRDQSVVTRFQINGGATPAEGFWIASVAAHESDPDSANNTATVSTRIAAVADLSLELPPLSQTLDRGSPLPLTATVTNQGPNTATDVNAVFTLPTALSYQSGAPSQGGPCALSADRVTCPLGTLAPAASATVTINTTAVAAGVATVGAHAESSAVDESASDVSRTLTILNVADGSVQIAESPSPATVGQALQYTATVSNAGPDVMTTPALNISVTGTTISSASSPQGDCMVTAATASCVLNHLPSGATASVTVNTTPTAAGTATASASLSFAGRDSNSANDSASRSTVVNAAPSSGSGGGGSAGGGGGGGGGGSLGVMTLLGLLLAQALGRFGRRRNGSQPHRPR